MRAKVINPYDSRAYTCAVLEMLDEGMLSKDVLIEELLSWMSEHDVRQFCERVLRDDETNECLIGPELEEDDDEAVEAMLNDFNYVGNKSHY